MRFAQVGVDAAPAECRVRVVLDANVFVSGAIQRGASFRIVQRWLTIGDFEVIMCSELLEEITDVLTKEPSG